MGLDAEKRGLVASDDVFDKWAAQHTMGSILELRELSGATFTEADRAAIVDGLKVIRTALVQPVGLDAYKRSPGAVSSQDYQRAQMQVIVGCFQLWSSGRLAEVEVDGGD